MKVSPHCHPESVLTGSTLANMVKTAKELGRTHFAYTDNGHLSSTLKAYNLSKDAGLKFIPGLEIYFKDNKCPVIGGTTAERCKYFTATLYCEDQTSFKELSKMVSTEEFPTTDIFEETQQLWSWDKLERIAKFNVHLVLGGPHCIVGKVLLAGHEDLAKIILFKLQAIFKNRLYMSITCAPWSKQYSGVVEIKGSNGFSTSLMESDLVTTNMARRIPARDLTTKKHGVLLSAVKNETFYDYSWTEDDVFTNKKGEVDFKSKVCGPEILETKLHKGFLPLPGGDVTLRINQFFLEMQKQYQGLQLLVTDYAYYAKKEDKIVQTMRLEGRTKLHANLHMKDTGEIVQYLTEVLKLAPVAAMQLQNNNDEWASKFDNFYLKYEWRLADSGENPIKMAMEIIRQNGRMKWDNPVWVDRLREELNVIAKNPVKDLTPYFLPIRNVLNFYKDNEQLVGPGRGSAGGSLFIYLLGITQIDPFKFDLPFNRFFSLDRIMGRELPDVDVDLPSRDLLVGEDGKSGFLYNTYKEKAAQISTRTTIRLKSAIKDTNRYIHGKVLPEVETFTKGLPAPPQGMSDLQAVFGFYDKATDSHIPGLIETNEDLQRYAKSHPKEWEIVSKAMGITRAFSKHASAFVLSDIPIHEMVPTKDGHVTQYEAKECEKAGLIKYDFLVINQLKDIEVCLKLINKKNGEKLTIGDFTHKGQKTYIWDLPEDPEVYRSIWTGKTETCFQINTKSMTPFVMDIMPQNMMDIATVQALVRPGPMDFVNPETGRNMTEEYVMRRKGESQPDIKELGDLLPETYGVITFQEQLNKIARNLAGFPGPRAETLRKHMAKKNMTKLMEMKPDFIEGAKKNVSPEVAEAIWNQMVTFGRYGFSVIHAVEYAHITYACMFLKHYYELEWWAAILTNATEQEITGKLWPYVKDIVSAPDINLSTDSMVIDYKNHKIRSKLGVIRGMGDATVEPLIKGRPYKDIQDFVDKDVAGASLSRKLIHVGVLDSLFPPKSNTKEKLKAYEDALEVKVFREKKLKAEASGKKMRALSPKQGVIPEEYLNLTPFEDIAMKKSVLPSLPVDIYSVAREHSKVLCPFEVHPKVMAPNQHETILVDGEKLKIIDEAPIENITKDVYVASTCYVIKTEEFSFPKAKPTKRALKMVIDCGGYITEKVMWPDYNTGQLIYDKKFKKGCIATVFLKRRAGKPDTSVIGLVVES